MSKKIVTRVHFHTAVQDPRGMRQLPQTQLREDDLAGALLVTQGVSVSLKDGSTRIYPWANIASVDTREAE
jgi:hypothetical protein